MNAIDWLDFYQFIFVTLLLIAAGYVWALKQPIALALLIISLAVHYAFAKLPFAEGTALDKYNFVMLFLYGPLIALAFRELLHEKTSAYFFILAFAPFLLVIFLIFIGLVDYSYLTAIFGFVQFFSIYHCGKALDYFNKVMLATRSAGTVPAVRILNLILWFYIIVIFYLLARYMGITVTKTSLQGLEHLIPIAVSSVLAYLVIRLKQQPDWVPQLDEDERAIFDKHDAHEEILDNAQQLVEELELFIKDNNPYLDPDISLKKLAQQIGWPARKVSQVINYSTGNSFSVKMNSARVERSIELMKNPAWAQSSLLDIALDAGFNSKASFNVMFKRHVGQTPSQYRKYLDCD